mgnify:CR=1 FL=1
MSRYKLNGLILLFNIRTIILRSSSTLSRIEPGSPAGQAGILTSIQQRPRSIGFGGPLLLLCLPLVQSDGVARGLGALGRTPEDIT